MMSMTEMVLMACVAAFNYCDKYETNSEKIYTCADSASSYCASASENELQKKFKQSMHEEYGYKI